MCENAGYKSIATIDPERWSDSDVRDAANVLLYMGLAETSYALGENLELSLSASAFRDACKAELRRRGEF